MNGLSGWAIRNPLMVAVITVVLTAWGLASGGAMGITSEPDAEKPKVEVTATRPGASPADMERQVTRLVETSVSGLAQVLHVKSTIVEGASVTEVEFSVGADRERITNDVRNAVAGLRSALPGDMAEPVVLRKDASDAPIATYVIHAPKLDLEAQSWLADDTVRRSLTALPGVARVDRLGGVEREVEVILNPDRLAAVGLTAAEISDALAANTGQFPGGRTVLGGRTEWTIRTQSGAQTVASLRALEIPTIRGARVRLGEVAVVRDRWADPRSLARFDGRAGVGFAVFKRTGFPEVQTAASVEAALNDLAPTFAGASFEQVGASLGQIQATYQASLEALILGAALAIAVVFLFLRDLRATLISALAIPLSLIPTLAVMAMLHQTLNAVTLLALSLTVGVLVDDAIVEIENIARHLGGGVSPQEASRRAAEEIGAAVIATSLSIVAIFAPVGFMPGVVGRYFQAFAVAACVSVLFSLLVARTLTPLLAARFMRPHASGPREPGWLATYLSALGWALRHRWITLGVGVGLFAASLAAIPLLPLEFQPIADVGSAAFTLELSPGATLEQTDALSKQASTLLMARPEVERVSAIAGAGGLNLVDLNVVLGPKAKRMSQAAFSQTMISAFSAFPGARVVGGDHDSAKLTLRLFGDDVSALEITARRLEGELRRVPGLTHVVNSESLARPEILIRPRPELAAQLGVSSAALARTIRVATLGDTDQAVAKIDLGGRRVPIRVRLDGVETDRLSALRTLQLPTAQGVTVPLDAVAEVTYGGGVTKVNRLDRYRIAEVTANLTGLRESEASKIVRDLPVLRSLPQSVHEGPSGSAELVRDLVSGFAMALPLGLALMYGVLLLLFRDLTAPLTIMLALPLAIGGALLALLATEASFSVATLIGVLMLLGIAAKNSILLADYTLIAQKRGLGVTEAVLDAGRKRARPIIMTTVAMSAGMAPIALGLGADIEFRQPMAIAVIGGLATSTLLSLFFVPAVFSLAVELQARLGIKIPIPKQGRSEVSVP